jgi:hypothetical protein
VHVAEQSRTGRAGEHAGRLALALRQGLVGDAVDAQGALLHHLLLLVELANAVGAGPGAVLAADALVVVDQHDAVVLALVRGAGRADRHAGGSSQCRQLFGKVYRLGVRVLPTSKVCTRLKKVPVGSAS